MERVIGKDLDKWGSCFFGVTESLGAGSSGLARLLRNQSPFPFLLCHPHDYKIAAVLPSLMSILSAGKKEEGQSEKVCASSISPFIIFKLY